MAPTRSYDRANALQRGIRRFAGSGPGSWVFARAAHRLDKRLYKLTNGRHTLATLVSGIPVVMLTTTGARSGEERTTPVLGLPTDEDSIAVIASNFGQEKHPAWYHNLRKNPEGTVTVDGDTWRFRAVVAEGERRERIWQDGLKIYPGFSQYEKRASHRDIAVFVLERA
jgi:deazaflavin-dependent oxidoreductase (nitroreductase family)